jgi:CheY-like chemotaxis protein
MPPVRVLCVDDEPGIRLMFPALLEPHGYEVTATGTVAEALSEIASRDFDVLISDLNIGNPGDGFTVVSAMRRTHPACLNLILTGYPALETALQAIRSQVDDYLLKPVDVPRVLSTIEQRLKDRKEHRDAPLATKRVYQLLQQRSVEIVHRTLQAMKTEPELSCLAITDEARLRQCAHALREIIEMLNPSNGESVRPKSKAVAGWRGDERFREGYSIPMLATSICLLERTIYDVIHEGLLEIDLSFLLPDLKRLHESLAKQLGESLRAYLRAESEVA